MGLTWIAEIASWQTVKYGLVREEVWYITDIINSLQGVLVFFVFVIGNEKVRFIPHKKGSRQTILLFWCSTVLLAQLQSYLCAERGIETLDI